MAAEYKLYWRRVNNSMARLNYKHLHYFWVVAREGSIAQAAQLLHVTPQTISGQLGQFEKSLGTKLFTRSGRHLLLTEAGRTAMEYAEDIFLLGAELEDQLSSRSSGRPLCFRVGVADVVPKLIAHRLLAPALQLAEPVRIICREGKLDNLLADIALHRLDMLLTDRPINPGGSVRAFNHLLGECGTAFFATPGLAQRYRDNFPYSLKDAPLLLPTHETAIRGGLTQWFDELQLHPSITGEFDDSALMKAFGQAGVGIFTAPMAIGDEVTRQYKVETVGQTNSVREQFYAISTERKLKHPAVIAIRDTARQKIFRRAGTLAEPEMLWINGRAES